MRVILKSPICVVFLYLFKTNCWSRLHPHEFWDSKNPVGTMDFPVDLKQPVSFLLISFRSSLSSFQNFSQIGSVVAYLYNISVILKSYVIRVKYLFFKVMISLAYKNANNK